ncbi:hypothetical protein [Streptomyces griseorubiginosus]|uniref:hypothetical protein n=1 Tax=Streptomyces griseorubiginosus TaxID=67304 RepID=UPI0011403972|nr:hypothetical protein [Streptomyces griseorubiginosus]
MNVLTCVACGTRLTGPPRLLPERPTRPEFDGRKGSDGSRPAPATVPRGAYAVDPEASGAPHVPHPDPEWCDAANPGNTCLGDPVGLGCLVPAGPRGTLVTHLQDTRAYLSGDPAVTEFGCCGPPGREGPGELCAKCGAVVATLHADRSGPYETGFLPDAVRVTAV